MHTLLCTSNLFYDKFHENEQNYFHLLQKKVLNLRFYVLFQQTDDDCTFIFMQQGWYYVCISSYFCKVLL